MQEKQMSKEVQQPKLAEINPATVQQIKANQTVHCLRKLMASLKVGPDQAMALLQIPTKERKSFRAILVNNKERKK